MPTALNVGSYRFFFYASDRDEPAHIHVERDDNVAKFWLDPVSLSRSGRFRTAELGRIWRLVVEHQAEFQEVWSEFFQG